LEIDPEQIHVESCLGKDEGIGIEHISSMAERKGAFAAINGSFFQMKAPFEGISSGLLKYKERSCLFFAKAQRSYSRGNRMDSGM